MYNTITIDPRPAKKEEMIALLKDHAPVIGVEFTLPALLPYIDSNIDGQHSANAAGKAAIEIAAEMPVPAEGSTFAIVRPDADALGAIAVFKLRQHYGELRKDAIKRIKFIALHDSFQFGEWPGPRNPEDLNTNPLFGALNAICMDFRRPIGSRVMALVHWIAEGNCDELEEAITKVISENERAIQDAEIFHQSGNIVAMKAHTMGATQVAYCYAPVAIIANDKFRFPEVEGEHLKYTICQFQAGKYVDLPAVVADLNKIEKGWGGSPAICGSPQGVSSSLKMEQVIEVVKSHLK